VSDTATAGLSRLIDAVLEAEASERDRARVETTRTPRLNVEIEDPIAWTALFGYEAERYFTDPAFYFEQFLRQKLWRFEHFEDDVPITLEVPAWLGHYPEYTFLGMDVRVTPKGVPIIQRDHPMSQSPDLGLLAPVDFGSSGWMPRALRWYDDLLRLADGRLTVTFMTWNRGCLDLAVQLRGYENLVLDFVERPDFVHGLVGFLADQRNRWYTARGEYLGEPIEATWMADDWVGVPYVSPGAFADFVLPAYLAIERHHGVIGGFHSCGNQTPMQCHLLKLRSLETFEVSPWTDVAQSVANVPPSKHLHLFVHPNDVVVDSPERMEEKLRARAEHLRGRRFSLGTSGLTPLTDDSRAFVDRVKRWLGLAREVFAE